MTLGELLAAVDRLSTAREMWMDSDEGPEEVFSAVYALVKCDTSQFAAEAAQYAQTLREMAVAASMPRPDAVRQARIDKLRAVADWLAPTGEQ